MCDSIVVDCSYSISLNLILTSSPPFFLFLRALPDYSVCASVRGDRGVVEKALCQVFCRFLSTTTTTMSVGRS